MSEAKWYVVHTYSGYENKVKVDIEKTIENRHLEDQILEVRVPLQEVAELKNGALKQVQKKMFPGYVLLNMVMNDDTWYVVRIEWDIRFTNPEFAQNDHRVNKIKSAFEKIYERAGKSEKADKIYNFSLKSLDKVQPA